MRALVVTASVAGADLAADALWQLGVRGIEERPVAGPPGAAGSVELWTSVGDDDDAIERARRILGDRWPLRVEVIDAPAADTWRDHARVVVVDDGFVVVPAWLDAPAVEGVRSIRIEPGGAFGLGDHPTTLLSLRAVRRLVTGPVDVLDVGCGTGVLAVTAAIAQERPVRAVDIADAAVAATADNAMRNGVADRVVVDTAPLSTIDAPFGVVLANVLAPALVELAAELRRLTAPGGALVISGILAGRHDHVLGALAPMVVERTDELDGWVAVTLRHPS